MWYLKYYDGKTGGMVEERYDTLSQAKNAYINNLSTMAYGAIYEANNQEEKKLANDLFEASEAELERREEEARQDFFEDENEEEDRWWSET